MADVPPAAIVTSPVIAGVSNSQPVPESRNMLRVSVLIQMRPAVPNKGLVLAIPWAILGVLPALITCKLLVTLLRPTSAFVRVTAPVRPATLVTALITALVVTLVIRPLASTVKDGIIDPEPYVPAVTPLMPNVAVILVVPLPLISPDNVIVWLPVR